MRGADASLPSKQVDLWHMNFECMYYAFWSEGENAKCRITESGPQLIIFVRMGPLAYMCGDL